MPEQFLKQSRALMDDLDLGRFRPRLFSGSD
jgi:hypothetical protein